MSFWRWRGDTLLLDCRIQPGARSDAFNGLHGERLKVRVQAPPVDGKANARLQRFLAAQFAVPVSRVQLVSGASSRDKTLAIQAPVELPEALGLGRT
ncbi:MAG TPA: DUF167 family protein [Spongiibacteraceae bacterium]|nr:DUF167 family protein [Spongiibacteraceae bacterium]HUH37584.1 DUF167 family protein [Spongiibacteraceae bacterium]